MICDIFLLFGTVTMQKFQIAGLEIYYTHGLSVLITALIKHRRLDKLQVYMFRRKVVGIHEQDFKKMWQFLYKNLTVFTGTFDDLDFFVKTG